MPTAADISSRFMIAMMIWRTPVISAGTAAIPNSVFIRKASSTSIQDSIAMTRLVACSTWRAKSSLIVSRFAAACASAGSVLLSCRM
ncbi:hypothetical protein [Streptomyces ziwulingensis]|uniref:hypothetical protein n=1 Tax=Streptomyces ziwulingensis TaxID=1045501 RepID=UPI0031EBA451